MVLGYVRINRKGTGRFAGIFKKFLCSPTGVPRDKRIGIFTTELYTEGRRMRNHNSVVFSFS
jgi:hypothetical protein